jgi:hypothetical protein
LRVLATRGQAGKNPLGIAAWAGAEEEGMTGWSRLAAGAAAIAVLAGGLAGCETTMDLLDRHIGGDETWIRIESSGAGPLDGSVPFDAARIVALLPDYTTGNALISLETQTTDALVLFHPNPGGAVQTLQVLPHADGRIGEIHGVSRQVRGPAGERPGMSFADAKVDASTCRMGTALWAGLAVCRSSGARNVLLTFSFRGAAGNATALPTGDDLATAELQRVIWIRPK